MSLRSFVAPFDKIINYKMASIGALVMGIIVGYINLDHGLLPASIAALKQAAYTFFLGGMLLKLLEAIALRIDNPVTAISISVTLVSIVTVSLIYLVHSMKGTPKPFESTIPTMIMAPSGFTFVAMRLRRKKLGWSRLEYYFGSSDKK